MFGALAIRKARHSGCKSRRGSSVRTAEDSSPFVNRICFKGNLQNGFAPKEFAPMVARGRVDCAALRRPILSRRQPSGSADGGFSFLDVASHRGVATALV
jgi:hypothetical protein